MDISEVEELLRSLKLLGLVAPQHIFITDEPITAEVDGKIFFRGVAPLSGSAIILSRDADITTVPHEIAHTLGFGELAADIIGKIAALKYSTFRGIPLPKIMEVRYREVDDVPPHLKGRVRHYVRA